ncbi:MAG TPA: hypothetical protein VGL40_07605 [Bacillota bacterium]
MIPEFGSKQVQNTVLDEGTPSKAVVALFVRIPAKSTSDSGKSRSVIPDNPVHWPGRSRPSVPDNLVRSFRKVATTRSLGGRGWRGGIGNSTPSFNILSGGGSGGGGIGLV